MKQLVQTQRNGHLEVIEVPPPVIRPDGVLVRSAFSLISTGTEKAKLDLAQKTLLGKAIQRPEDVRRVLEAIRGVGVAAAFRKTTARLNARVPLGYSLAGTIVEIGSRVQDLAPGDRVACAGGGYASHAEMVFVPRLLCQKIPPAVTLEEAAFCTVGAIALQGVRQANALIGETVTVIGLGLLGLLTVQLLRVNGCKVIAFDPLEARGKLAQEFGAEAATTPKALIGLAKTRIIDAVIITAATSSNGPIRLAGEVLRDRGRVVVVGAVGLDVPRSGFYDKELEIRMSRSYGPGRYDRNYEERGHDYPIGYVRWTEGRNMAAFLDMQAAGRVDVKKLISHRFKIADAVAAYHLISTAKPASFTSVVIDYSGETPAASKMVSTSGSQSPRSRHDSLAVAVIGAGNFAQSVILPALSRNRHVHLMTIVSQTGLSARHVAEQFGAEQAAADAFAAIEDSTVDAVVIASNHASHAALVVQAIRAGKAVFVEKPLAINDAQLKSIVAAWTAAGQPLVMVDFNRRFARLVQDLKSHFRDVSEPLLLQYRVNAGYIPREHWTQSSEEGGRIIGEACHFVDLVQFLVHDEPKCLTAYAVPDGARYNLDNIVTTIRFDRGSVATITYAANGDTRLAKERLEIFGGGRVAVLDDFSRLTVYHTGRRKVTRARHDKGHNAALTAFVDAARRGEASPIPFGESVTTTHVTFSIL